MKYYEMHEIVYQQLKAEGLLSWDKSSTFDQMWSHGTNVYLGSLLPRVGVSFSGLRVLDLGTGTGTSALFAAKQGAESVGIEISKSAVEIARSNAQKLGLNAEFIVGDVLDLDLKRKFNLIIDSTILHCIVGNVDRKRFYDTVKKHLDKDGLFFVNTMITSENMSSRFPKEYFLFQDDILWSLGISEITERKLIDGKSYFPHRTLMSEQNQIHEFNLHGFDVIEIEKVSEADGGFGLVALLRMKT